MAQNWPPLIANGAPSNFIWPPPPYTGVTFSLQPYDSLKTAVQTIDEAMASIGLTPGNLTGAERQYLGTVLCNDGHPVNGRVYVDNANRHYLFAACTAPRPATEVLVLWNPDNGYSAGTI